VQSTESPFSIGAHSSEREAEQSELRVAPRDVFDAALLNNGGSGGSRSFARLNFSSFSGGTAALNTERLEACAASNSAAGENRLHHEKMLSHFPSL